MMVFLRAILIACAFAMSAAFAGEHVVDKPSGWFCWVARGALAAAGSEAAAEKAARDRGVSEVTIAKAKRCPR